MKMFRKITVSIEGVSNIDISEVRARLVRALRAEEAGKIVESGDVIHYRRGYPIRAYVQNRLASFDPGLFAVTKAGGRIVLRYRLCLYPLIPETCAVAGGIMFFSWVAVENPDLSDGAILMILAFASIFILVIGTAVFRLRRWLRSVIEAAVRDGLARDEGRKVM